MASTNESTNAGIANPIWPFLPGDSNVFSQGNGMLWRQQQQRSWIMYCKKAVVCHCTSRLKATDVSYPSCFSVPLHSLLGWPFILFFGRRPLNWLRENTNTGNLLCLTALMKSQETNVHTLLSFVVFNKKDRRKSILAHSAIVLGFMVTFYILWLLFTIKRLQ